jgi:hypothetical protein
MSVDMRTELEQIVAGEDVVQGRGFLVEYNHEWMMAVFTRIHKIYSTAGTTTSRVWDVVDYNESDNGRQIGTYYTAKEAKRMIA